MHALRGVARRGRGPSSFPYQVSARGVGSFRDFRRGRGGGRPAPAGAALGRSPHPPSHPPTRRRKLPTPLSSLAGPLLFFRPPPSPPEIIEPKSPPRSRSVSASSKRKREARCVGLTEGRASAHPASSPLSSGPSRQAASVGGDKARRAGFVSGGWDPGPMQWTGREGRGASGVGGDPRGPCPGRGAPSVSPAGTDPPTHLRGETCTTPPKTPPPLRPSLSPPTLFPLNDYFTFFFFGCPGSRTGPRFLRTMESPPAPAGSSLGPSAGGGRGPGAGGRGPPTPSTCVFG